MVWFWVTLIIVVVIAIVLFFMSVKIVKQYERGVVLRFGRLHSVREPGIRFIIPIVDVMTKVSLRIVTVPIQSQGIITQDNVSVGRLGGGVLPHRRPGEVGDRDRERAVGDRPDRADHAAQGRSASTTSTRRSPRRPS